MKYTLTHVIIALLLVSGGISGCEKTRQEVDQIGQNVVINSQERANLLKLRTNLKTINQSIQVFHAANGRYPETLDELAQRGIIHKIPSEPFGGEWVYDATTGTVTSSSHPDIQDASVEP